MQNGQGANVDLPAPQPIRKPDYFCTLPSGGDKSAGHLSAY